MISRNILPLLSATLIGSAILTSPSKGAVTINFAEGAGQVTATFSGSINLNALSMIDNEVPVEPDFEGIIPNEIRIGIGSFPTFDPYSGISGPRSIGPGSDLIAPTSTTGDFVGFWVSPDIGPPPEGISDLFVPNSYSSGSPLSGSSTWVGGS